MVDSNNYGDYVDYPVDLGIGEDGTQDDWKIFYDNGTNIFIIAADYVPTIDGTATKLQTAASSAGMTQSTEDLKKKYCWYWNPAPTNFNSKATPGIETLFRQTKWKVNDHQDLTNSKCVSELLDPDKWSGFKDGEGYAQYAVGGPTVEMWCESWNAAHVDSKIYTNKGASESAPGYYVGTSEFATTTSYELIGIDATRDKLWYPNYNAYAVDGSNACYGYWLASPSASSTGNALLYVWFGGKVNNANYADGLGLRPVVCLNSGVSATYDAGTKTYTLSK